MAFIHRNDVVQQVAAAALDPSLRAAVLPGAFERGLHGPDLQRSNGCWYLGSVLAVTVKDEKPGSGFKRKHLPQLLDDPKARRMFRHFEVKNLTTIVTDHEEAVEQVEPDGWNGEEVHGRDGFSMVPQE